ncbi:beta-carotene isomerase D27 [Hibiscus syriacus]|uniref:Beta-carotene isomerase D27 n=1 Tax=Hibiscus syriacus TaxID=106335 RepID=A0A6A2YFK1_HIBSY|nr:protein CANDIDATE G-PROTEIN COUPLED RECEPTOR 7-like [Hibiscus syriacus]KAE8675439.1 beta-carotene isomerase D27 [Hibiscus syriacus]
MTCRSSLLFISISLVVSSGFAETRFTKIRSDERPVIPTGEFRSTHENRRDYLSAGETILPRVYFLSSLAYIALALIWIYVLYKSRLTVSRIHFLVLILAILKAFSLVFEAEYTSYIKRTGGAPGRDILYHSSDCFKGILLSVLALLIGTSWSQLKPYLEDKVPMIVIPLQAAVNGAQLVVDETSPFGSFGFTWRIVIVFVDAICYWTVLLPIARSTENSDEAAQTDGNAAVNSTKRRMVIRCCVVVVGYIYLTRVLVSALVTISSYKHPWTTVLAVELCTIAFFVLTCYRFMPEARVRYSVIVGEEKEAVAEVPLLEDEGK